VRSLGFTYYVTVHTNEGELVTRSWSTWIEVLIKHQIRKDKDGPALVFGFIPSHLPRSKRNTRHANALVLDLDNVSEEMLGEVLERLAPYEFVAHSTHSHFEAVQKGLWKLRIIAPLAEPVAQTDFPKVWKAWNEFTLHSTDPATKDISRLYYLPSSPDPSAVVYLHNKGEWLHAEKHLPLEATIHSLADSAMSDLEGIRRALKRAEGVEEKDRETLRALAEGRPFAEPDSGERHVNMRTLTWWLARRDSMLSRLDVEGLFRASLTAMQEQSPDAPTMDATWSAYETAVEKLAETRHQKALKAQRENTEGPYSHEDMLRIAEKQCWKPEELARRWVVQKDGAAWFLDHNGEYQGPFGRDDHLMACLRFLPRTEARLVEITKNGVRNRPPATVIAEVGSLAQKTVCDLSAQFTRYDPETSTLYEAVSPIRRDLVPTYHDTVDDWLRAIGGKHYEKLCDWLAVAPDLDQMLCAIYFDGPKGAGKSMFAHGVAALWSETATPGDIELFLGAFNDTVAMCPLVFADEDMPKHQTRDVTAKLREELATTSRILKRKFLKPSEMRGAIRLCLAANNELLIAVKKAMTPNDLDAFAERFLYIRIPDSAQDYFSETGREDIRNMLTRGIAEHALHLQATRKIQNSGSRFAVGGDVQEIHQLFLTSGHWNGLVCEWLVKYLMNPLAYNNESNNAGLVRCLSDEGMLLANPQGLSDNWTAYIKSGVPPSTPEIATALRSLSVPVRAQDGSEKQQVQRRWQGRHHRYSVVNINALLAWSRRSNIGDPASMLFALGVEATEAQLGLGDGDVHEDGDAPDNVTLMRRRAPSRVREDGGLDYGDKEEER